MYFLNCFFIYSFLGFILESLFSYIFGYNYNSGILYGPITPLYGFGAIIVIIISSYCFRLHLPRWIETIVMFVIVTILLSLIEFIGGNLIENIFSVCFWDYSDYKFHFGKYICLEMSIVWGVLSVIFIYLIKPILDNYIILIPKKITFLFCILLMVDLVVTFFIKGCNL